MRSPGWYSAEGIRIPAPYGRPQESSRWRELPLLADSGFRVTQETLAMAKYTVIYTRFTDPKQREESNEAQERKVRQCFDYLKIGHADAIVLKDSAQRGDLEDRACYDRLLK